MLDCDTNVMTAGQKVQQQGAINSSYSSNVRYILAKQKIDDLFLKFLSQASTQEVISNLVRESKSPGGIVDSQIPNPVFTSPKLTLQNSMISSTILSQSPKKYPNSSNVQNLTAESSDKEKENRGRKIENVGATSVLSTSKVGLNSNSNSSNIQQQQLSQTLKDQQKIDAVNNSSLLQSVVATNKASYEEIPQFYFPSLPSSASAPSAGLTSEQNKIISDILGKKTEINLKDCTDLTVQLLQLPSFLASLILTKIDPNNQGKVAKSSFLNYLTRNLIGTQTSIQKTFNILKNSNSEFITKTDLHPLIKVLLDTHPGLEFLKATPEFQERYEETVILRIMFMVNRQDNGCISWKEFKKSNLFAALQQVDKESDINKVREYFSYEHFYVLYCKFWELDQDHDFMITKEEFSKYSGHALSRLTVDRIFQQAPRKFKSENPERMSYEDFTWFVLAEEDKTTIPSIEYWFKVIDLDENGIIAGYEMNSFFEEQRQRLEYLNHDNVLFEDILCQMVDLLKPEDEIKFSLEHFKAKQKQCGVFFNFLTNLNKLVQYETRDPFAARQEITLYPDYSEWDRFALNEYQRLAMEEENNEQEVFNDGVDPWDQDTTADSGQQRQI